MGLFDSVGAQTAKTITDALPGVEKTVTDAVVAVQTLVNQSLIPILAEVVSTAISQCDRLDGATITLEPSGPVTITVPSFKLTVSMPLRPTS